MGSDREEAVAPIDNNSKETTPPRVELTPLLEGNIEDTDMTSGFPGVEV